MPESPPNSADHRTLPSRKRHRHIKSRTAGHLRERLRPAQISAIQVPGLGTCPAAAGSLNSSSWHPPGPDEPLPDPVLPLHPSPTPPFPSFHPAVPALSPSCASRPARSGQTLPPLSSSPSSTPCLSLNFCLRLPGPARPFRRRSGYNEQKACASAAQVLSSMRVTSVPPGSARFPHEVQRPCSGSAP
jgi:hypothetical protein